MTLSRSADPRTADMRDRIALLEMQLREANAQLALGRVAWRQAEEARRAAVDLLADAVTRETCMCARCGGVRAGKMAERVE